MEENTDIESSVSTPEKKEALLKRDCEKRGADEKEPLSASEDDPCLSINNKSETTKDEPDTKHVFFKTFSRNGSNGNTGKKKKTNNDRNSSFVNRLEKRLHTKTGFNRKGLIFVTVIIFLLFAFFIVTVVLASTWPRKSHLELTPVCKKPPCLLASAEILEKRNTRVSPCEDFWTYACGNWLKSNPLPVTRSKWDQEEQLATKYRGELRDLITTLPYPTRTSSVQWKLKYFYESCMSIDSIEADAAGPLRLIINELGGWNVLREFSVLTYDYRDHLTKLHSKYGVSPFFEVVVVPDPENTEKNIVQVRPSGLGLPDRSFYYRRPENAVELTYKRFLKDAAQILGATSTDAVAFSDEMYHFEKRIAEGTPDIQQLQHPFTYQKVSLAELKMKAASIPLYDIIAHKYPNAKLDDTVEILTSEMYLAHISSILSTTDRGILNNYLVWTLASAYLPYLSKRYQDVVNMYIKEMTGIQQPFERWEMCIETLQKFMGFVLTALHESNINSQAREDNRKAVNEMFETIVESTRGSIRFSEWFGHELKQYMVQKLNVLGLQVGFPGPMMSSTYLEEYYSNLYVQKKNFFQNILFGVSFLQYADERKLTNPVEEYRWMDHLIRSHGVLYVPVANKVVLPQRILRVPYFHHQFPLPVLYGNFGTQLASTIVSSILPWNILHGATGNLISEDDIIINQTLRGIQHTQKFTISNIKKSGGSELIANLTALKTVIEISALKQAHFALQHVMKELPHSHVPAIEELENDALYYLAYAQSLCAESTSQQDDIDILKTSKLKGPLMLKTTLPQMKEFSAAYSCSGQILHNSFPLFT